MIRRTFLVGLPALVATAALAEGDLVSGPEPGKALPELKVLDVTGPQKDKELNYVAERKDKPTVYLFLREFDRQAPSGQRGVGDESNQRSFEFANIGLDAASDVERHVVWQRYCLRFGPSLENSHFCLEIRRLNICDQSPFETRAQPLLERGNLVRRAIAT